MKFIGIGHQKQQGKDTFAMMLGQALASVGKQVQIHSFAGPLKSMAQMCFGLTPEQCDGTDEQKNSLTQVTLYDLGMGTQQTEDYLTAREVLQKLGTDRMRALFPQIWVNAPFKIDWEEMGLDYVIIPDTRFVDEADAVLANGGDLIRINRPDHSLEDSHPSETALLGYDRWTAHVENDDSLDELDRLAHLYAVRLVKNGTVNGEADTTVIHHASKAKEESRKSTPRLLGADGQPVAKSKPSLVLP